MKKISLKKISMKKHWGKMLLGVALICGSTPLFAHDDRGHNSYDADRSHDRHEVRYSSRRVVRTVTTVERGHHDGWDHRAYRAPTRYRDSRYVVTDWRYRHLRAPPRGYHYVRGDRGDVLLVAISTGILASVLTSQ